MTTRTPVCPTSSSDHPRSAVTDVPAQVTFWPQPTITKRDSDHSNLMDSDSSDHVASSIRGMLGPTRVNPRRPPMAPPTYAVPTLATPMHHPTPSRPFTGISSPIQAMSPPQDVFYPHLPLGSMLRNLGPPPQPHYVLRPQFQPPPMSAPILRWVPPPLPPRPSASSTTAAISATPRNAATTGGLPLSCPMARTTPHGGLQLCRWVRVARLSRIDLRG
jgi:hypothetical protein